MKPIDEKFDEIWKALNAAYAKSASLWNLLFDTYNSADENLLKAIDRTYYMQEAIRKAAYHAYRVGKRIKKLPF